MKRGISSTQTRIIIIKRQGKGKKYFPNNCPWGGQRTEGTVAGNNTTTVQCIHRIRIDLEDKAKVVAYAWGAESLLR